MTKYSRLTYLFLMFHQEYRSNINKVSAQSIPGFELHFGPCAKQKDNGESDEAVFFLYQNIKETSECAKFCLEREDCLAFDMN